MRRYIIVVRMRVGAVFVVDVNRCGIHIRAGRISNHRGGIVGVCVGTVFVARIVGRMRMVSATANGTHE